MNKIEVIIATRSIFRNRRRMLVTVSTVAIAVFVCVLLRSITSGFEDVIAGQAIDQNVGALQIHKQGYSQRGSRSPLKYKFRVDEELLRRISTTPGVKALAPRIVFESQLSVGPHLSMLSISGVHPHFENQVCPESRRVESLQASTGNASIALGETLAKTMSLPGRASGILSATNAAGRQNAMDILLGAPFRASNPLESKGIGIVTLDFAQRLLGMPGEATEIAVAVHDRREIDAIVHRIRETLGEEYEVESWLDLEPALKSIMEQQSRNMALLMGILGLLVTFGLSNTMVLAVSERTREIGTLASIGATPATVTRLFVFEGLSIGALGSFLGLSLGALVVLALGSSGVTLASQSGTDPMTIIPRFDGAFALLIMAFAISLSVIASLVPARQAAKMKPVEALASI